MDLVSVILPTYNRCNLLKRAIESVLSQTYKNLELIIINDASTDKTEEVVNNYNDNRVKYFKNKENKGLSFNRNLGIKKSRAKYVAFLDDDDEWLPTKLKKQMALIKKSKFNPMLVYCWMQYKSGDGELLHTRKPEYKGNIFKDTLVRQPIGNGSTWLVKKEVFNKIGYFDEDLSRGIDGDLIRRLTINYSIDYVDEVLVNYYIQHRHKRITSCDKEGLKAAVEGEKTKLRKFKNKLEKYPNKKAKIYMRICQHYASLNQTNESWAYFKKAIKTAPFSIQIYSALFRTFKKYMEGDEN